MFQRYLDAGICVVPLRNGIPSVKWGQYNDKLPDDITGWDKFNEIAVVLGRISDVIALDIDTDNAAIIKSIEDFVGVSPVKKIGSKGFTAFYRYNDEKTKSWGGVVELLSNKHLTTIPPSKHREKDLHYTWQGQELIGADLPYLPPDFYEFMEGMYPSPVRDESIPLYHYQYNDATFDEVASALNSISPDCNRAEWVKIGMALRDYLGDTAYSLWHEWSKKSPKYKSLDAHHAWKSYNDKGITIATLFKIASDNHWERPRTARPENDTSITNNIINEAVGKKEVSQPAIPKKSEFTFNPDKLEGIMGDTVRYILQDSWQPQPVLALLNTIAFAGAVFGRRYESPVETRTNIYIVGIADTASGKDTSRKKIARLAEAAGLGSFVGSNAVRSDSGVARSLSNNPCQIMHLDEYGKFLQALTDPKASPHHKSVVKLFMSVYSDSGAVYKHGEYTDTKHNKQIVIHNPNLCIYGTTTENDYVKALNKDSVQTGELNRSIALKVNSVPPVNVLESLPIPQDLIDAWALYAPDTLGSILNDPAIPPVPITVGWGDCEQLQWDLLQEQYALIQADRDTGAIWGRMRENIIKIAMIFAIARNKTIPEMRKSDFDIARKIVFNSINYMLSVVNGKLADNDYEKNFIEIFEYIKASKKQEVSRTELFRKFRKFKRKELDEFLSGMIDQERICIERVMSGKKPVLMYKIEKE